MRNSLENQKILHIAIPAIIANIAIPLLGLADTSIIGHLGNTAFIGALAVGNLWLSMVFWLFSFLRMGVGGLVAQSYGQGDRYGTQIHLFRSLALAWGLSIVLLLGQYWILDAFVHYMPGSTEVIVWAKAYYTICIWGAPAVLTTYVITGWYIGIQDTRTPMYTAIIQNTFNILVSLTLVYALDWGFIGAAVGTLCSQYVGVIYLSIGWYRRRHLFGFTSRDCWRQVRCKQEYGKLLRINRDIFFRTFCLIAVSVSFTSLGAQRGDITLAVNTLLIQFFMFFSYVIDGFAYAAESLCGQAFGANRKNDFQQYTLRLLRWGFGIAIFFTTLYIAGGYSILSLLTNQSTVIQAAYAYLPWVWCIPLVSFVAFIYDGVFIGSTSTRYMLWPMVAALIIFWTTYEIVTDTLGTHALWLAYLAYLGTRSLLQKILYVKLLRQM